MAVNGMILDRETGPSQHMCYDCLSSNPSHCSCDETLQTGWAIHEQVHGPPAFAPAVRLPLHPDRSHPQLMDWQLSWLTPLATEAISAPETVCSASAPPTVRHGIIAPRPADFKQPRSRSKTTTSHCTLHP